MANIIGLGKKRVPGIDPCEFAGDDDQKAICATQPEATLHNYDPATGMVDWVGVQVADHSDVLIAAAFQFTVLFTFITSLLLVALATRKDKATLNKRKGIILVAGYCVAVIGYMIVSRGIVRPGTDNPVYPTADEE